MVKKLRRLERRDPSPELEKAVARRIALAGDPPGLLDRFESQLSIFTRQSPILPMTSAGLARRRSRRWKETRDSLAVPTSSPASSKA